MKTTHALDATTDTTANLLWLHAGHLTVAEAAAATGRSTYEVYDAIARGDLPARTTFVISMEDLSNL